ncbi:MAG: single-stranded-DNA-specific exonuclease RecJ [Planctomycetes bacterium]|jgi:single-stranded-DNA-specific exonuclease|nr:single-stranded-DNA-specific exonuclease RecJ [Planctomycetota bacterium]
MPLSAKTQQTLWIIPPADSRAEPLAQALRIAPLVAQVLLNRGITEAESGSVFLQPKLTELIRPGQMPGIEPAVARLKEAVEKKQKITVYGDYDVDGITGVSILWELLTLLGAQVDFYIPHRIEEGYGLNREAVRSLAEAGTQLLITVDCGIAALEAADLARQLGVDLVVTDHHQPGPALPSAVAIVHPALQASYANQDSAGALVAYKLAWAVAEQFSNGPRLDTKLRQFMLNATSLAAIGTVADVVDLRGENRVLTKFGLQALPESKLCGLRALIESAGLKGQGVDSYAIGFRLAPVLNAAGRMGHARLAVELLTCTSEMRALQIAEYLKQQNVQRQQCERKMVKQACDLIVERGLNHPDHRSLVLAAPDWHTGVLGIVASRLVDKYFRPTIMINASPGDSGTAQGSARSIPGFCMLSAIQACSSHLASFGGHTMAAGLTIPPQKIEPFAADFEAYAVEHLREDDVVAKLDIDALVPLRQFTRETVTQLEILGPFGQGNPKPVFATKGVRLIAAPRRVGAKGDHLQFAVTDNTATVRGVGFRMGHLEKKLLDNEYFNLAYEAQLNHYNGNTSVEFIATDIQFE